MKTIEKSICLIIALAIVFINMPNSKARAQLNTPAWPANGAVTIGHQPQGGPLDLLHLHGQTGGTYDNYPFYADPALRISFGQSEAEQWGTLSLESGINRRSTISQLGDFELAGAHTAQDVIIASLNGGESLTQPGTFNRTPGSIRFTTTPLGAGGGGVNADIERMTISPDGNVGIAQPAPTEKLDVNGDVKLV